MIVCEAPPARAGVALWLVPTGVDAAALKEQVEGLAHELGTPRFDPHLTLLSRLPAGEPDLVTRAAQLAGELAELELTVAEPEESPAFYRCVTLRVKDRVPLRDARRRAERIFAFTPEEDFEPHLSVVYGDFGEPRRLALAARLAEFSERTLIARFLDVMDVEGAPADWRRLARLPLDE